MPALTPVTIPVLPTVATAVLLLVHVPPARRSVNVTDEPVHRLPGPVIGGAGGHHVKVSPFVGFTVLLCLHVALLIVPAVVLVQLVVVVLLL